MSERPQGTSGHGRAAAHMNSQSLRQSARDLYTLRGVPEAGVWSRLCSFCHSSVMSEEESRIQASSIPQCVSCIVSASVVRGFRDSAVPASP